MPADLRILWPEQAPEDTDAVDQESVVLAERRARAFRLFSRGRSMRAIAAELKCGLGTVSRDVNHVLDSYRLTALQDAAGHIAREIARLTEVERELWEAWERSLSSASRTITERSDGGRGQTNKARMERHERDGDPRWMKLILEAWEKRCRLLGVVRNDDAGKTVLPPVKLVAGFDPVEAV